MGRSHPEVLTPVVKPVAVLMIDVDLAIPDTHNFAMQPNVAPIGVVSVTIALFAQRPLKLRNPDKVRVID